MAVHTPAYEPIGVHSAGPETCRYCARPIIFWGVFWRDGSGQIYCRTSGGQHEPVKVKEPAKP